MKQPQEYKIISLRECPTPESLQVCETPEQAAEYWRLHIATAPRQNSTHKGRGINYPCAGNSQCFFASYLHGLARRNYRGALFMIQDY